MNIKRQSHRAAALTGALALTLASACGSSETLNPNAPEQQEKPAQSADVPVAGSPEAPAPAVEEEEEAAPVAKPVEAPAAEFTVTGKLTDKGPTISQSVDLGLNHSQVGLGGVGTVGGTTEVVISEVKANGDLEAVGKAVLKPDGTFAAELDADAAGKLLIAQAVNAEGEVLGSALVAIDAGKPGEVVITAESSLEAAVVLATGVIDSNSACDKWECVECPQHEFETLVDPQVGLALDAVTMIDADVLKGLKAAVDAGLDVNVAIQALANGLLAGSTAEIKLLSELDVDVDGEAKAAAQLMALRGIMADAAASLTGDADIDLDVTADIAIAGVGSLLSSSNASPATGIQVQAAKDMALNGVLSGMQHSLDPDLNAALDGFVFAQAQASAAVESQALVEVLNDILTRGGAEQAIIDTINTLAEQAVLDVHASASVEALAEAQGELMLALTGQGSSSPMTGNPLVDLLGGTSIAAGGVIDAGLSAVADLSVGANAAVLGLVGVNLGVNLCIDVHAKAEAEAAVEVLVGEVLDFDAQLKDLAAGKLPADLKGSGNVDLLAEIFGAVGATLK